MRNRPWWQEEFLATEENQKYINWLEKQNLISELKQKEKTIIQAYFKEMRKIDDVIDMLNELKNQKIRECNECLAKICTGGSGLISLQGEKNTLK